MEKFTYSFDEKTGIMFKSYFGSITFHDIESSWLSAFEKNIIPQNVTGFIVDYRKATFDMTPEEHVEIADFYQKHLTVFGNKKIGVITDNAKDVIIPVLVERKDNGYISRPFSTVDAAILWIIS